MPAPLLAAPALPADPYEIVVTAERRPRALGDLPVSVSALGRDALDSQNVLSTRDLAGRLPNLSVLPGISNGTAAVFTMRGIATAADETLGFDNPVGLYLDGVPMPRATAAAIDLMDVERVEVLRGPQGTLFGRNTTGGAISLVPRRPSATPGLVLRADTGSRAFALLRGRLDTGALGPLRLSLAGQHERRDGHVRNLLQPDPGRDPGSGTVHGLRGAAEADLGADWRLTLTADWLESRGTPPASQIGAAGDGQRLPPLASGGDLFLSVQPAPVGRWLANATAAPGCPLAPGTRRRAALCLQDAGPVRDTLWGGLVRLEGAVGSLALRATTAARFWRNRAGAVDVDGLPAVTGPLLTPASLLNGIPADTLARLPGFTPALAAQVAALSVPAAPARLFGAGNERRTAQWTQEIELRSPAGARVEWTAGLFGLLETGRDTNRQQFGIVIDTVQAIFLPQFGALGPLLAAGLPPGTRDRFQALPDRVLAYQVENASLAAYGQAAGRLGGGFGLTLGGRLTHDRRTLRRQQNGTTPFNGSELAANDRTARFTVPTGHLTLDWRRDDSLLAWLRLARGYQSGGFNARQPTRPAAPGQTGIALQPFDAERLWAAEVGARYSAPGLHLSGALFTSWHDDKLVGIVIPDAPTLGTLIVNAARVRYTGFELETGIVLAPWLRADGNVGYTHARIGRFPAVTSNGTVGDIAPLSHLPNVPPVTASLALTGTWPLASDARLAARAGWVHVGPQRFFGNPLFAPFAAEIRAGPSHRFELDLRVADLTLAGLRATVALWARGLGRPVAVRGVDTGQLGFGTLLFAEPQRLGLTLQLAR